MTQTLSKDKLTLAEAIFSAIAFTLTLIYSHKAIEINFSSIIGLGLYYMIYIELTRALFDFVFGVEHKFKVRYIYDLGIIFLVREILVSITANHHHIIEELYYLSISCAILFLLFILRVIDARVFNYNNKCNSCVHSYKKSN